MMYLVHIKLSKLQCDVKMSFSCPQLGMDWLYFRMVWSCSIVSNS